MIERRRARDIALVDFLDALERRSLNLTVWRVARQGRDPLEPSRGRGRWTDTTFNVLYTSEMADGAIAEIFALLSDQPIFPSKAKWSLNRLNVRCGKAAVLGKMTDLARLDVDAQRYREREYARTQEIADAAFFLGFDALLVPSARWDCRNLVLFTDHLAVDDIALDATEQPEIDWPAWRRRVGR